MKNFTIVPGPASNNLAEAVANGIGSQLLGVELKVYPDGESKVRLRGELSGEGCVLIQSTCPPVDRNLVQLFLMCQGIRRMGKELYIVVPYFGYSRQDKEFIKGEVISLNMVADILATYSPKLLITFDFHNPSAISTFRFPVQNLSAVPAIANYLKRDLDLTDPICISPDKRAYEIAKGVASFLGEKDSFFFEKTRDRESGEVTLKGPPIQAQGRDVLILDDMISTGGSASKVARIAKNGGARRVVVACTHPLLVEGALENLRKAGVDLILGSNSVPGPFSKVDLSPLVVESLSSHDC